MQKPTTFKWAAVLCSVIMLNACQKDFETKIELEDQDQNFRNTGLVLSDAATLSTNPLIVSTNYLKTQTVSLAMVRSASAKGRPPKNSADNTVPVVSITSPVNGSEVSGLVNINATASDNIGVVSVSFYIDGSLHHTKNEAPYNYAHNFDNLNDGTHTIAVVAMDAAGNTNTASITVSKNTTITVIDPPPPSTLPSSYQLKMPPVGNQGSEFSCVAYATSYARSSEKYYKTNATSYSLNTNIFSPEYIYNQVKFSECYSGTTIERCLNLLKAQGVSTWQSFPYSSTNGCSLMPNAAQVSEAANYKIGSYAMLYPDDLDAIKNMLVNNHALITGSPIDNDFQNAGPGFIWSSFNGSFGNNHGYVICGYDDSKNAFKIMNSWGTNWGDNGYAWIDYQFFGTIGAGVFVMNDAY